MISYIGLSLLSIEPGTVPRNRREGTGRALLSAEARRILSQFEGRPLAEEDMAHEPQGRPFFPDRRDVSFNIAHSGTLAAVSYSGGGNLRTGCDVEQVRLRKSLREIAERFFSASENDYIFARNGSAETRFFEIWTLKECYIKLRGISVGDMASVPSFIHNNAFAFGADVSLPLSFYLYELSGSGTRYMLAAALEGADQQPPEIRWFSQPVLACSSIAVIKANPPAT